MVVVVVPEDGITFQVNRLVTCRAFHIGTEGLKNGLFEVSYTCCELTKKIIQFSNFIQLEV